MIPAPVYYAMPYVLAFLLAIGIPLAAALQYRLARSLSPEVRILVLLIVVSVGALAAVALTPRNLDERDLAVAGRQLISDLDDGFAASRYLNMFLVGTASVELLRGWINERAAGTVDPARPILFGLVAFYVGTVLIQALGSAHPDFSYKSLYLPIVLLAACYQRVTNVKPVLVVAKGCVLVLMVASLAGMVVKPDFVLHRPEPGLIPGIDFRLFGLTTHANTLGPIALVGLILELHSPSAWRLVRWASLLSATAVLVLAQSKTAWVAGALILMLVSIPLGFSPDLASGRRVTRFNRAVLTLWLCIAALIAAASAFAAVDLYSYVERTTQVDTLTGRTQIWELTLEGWKESLMFGYGREIWGAERMMKFRFFHVGQAHNQFIQTLGEAGLAGFALLSVYLVTLLLVAVRRFAVSRGLVLSLLILVFARCVTEAPLRTDGVQTWSTFTNVLLIVFTCYFMRIGVAGARHRSAWTKQTGSASACVSGVAAR